MIIDYNNTKKISIACKKYCYDDYADKNYSISSVDL